MNPFEVEVVETGVVIIIELQLELAKGNLLLESERFWLVSEVAVLWLPGRFSCVDC